MSKLPSIPSIPGNVDPQLYQVLSALKSNIDNLPTNTVTQTDLIKAVSSVPPGEVGPPGPNGDSYVLDITGGNTTIIYNEYGLSPLPHLVPFGYLFYKNGVSITTGLAFSWSITHPGNSLLSGISTSDTFIPAIAPTFDKTKADNSVFLVVTHLGMKFTAAEPISISAIGATGNDVANFSINNAAATFNKNANNTISPSAGINLTTTVQNITSPTYQWQLNSVNISGATADSYTVPTSAYASVTSNTYKCIVTGIINGITGSTLDDTITIPLLVDGLSVPTVVLSNESLSFTALNKGYTGIAFTGGGCNVTAYIGSTGLAYGTTGASTFSCTNSSTGATVAAGIGSGSSYAVAAPTAMAAETAYTDVIVTMRDASGTAIPTITKRISYSLSRAGKSHLLFITGGITNAIYDEYGSTPLPAQTAFSCELYENETLVTPATYAWSVPSTGSLLTGSSSAPTFTPTVAATFDSAKANNKVLLTATFAGITLKASQTIVMTQQAPIDVTPPPAINGLIVRAGVLYNFLSWGTLPGNSDHVEIWRCATNNRDAAIPATKVGTSLFTIYADYIPEGVGTLYYYWIRAMSIAGVAGAWNAPAINGTYATPGGITDLQVSSLTASSIDVASLGALSANLGNITAGVMTSPTGRMLINLTSPQRIVIAASTATAGTWNPTHTAFTEGSYTNGHYIKIDDGEVKTYKWNGTKHESSSSLNTLEAGVCTSGATVVLTKYYATQPKVMVSPYKMLVYNQTYPEQNQTLTLNNVVSANGAIKGHYSFVATATLNIAPDISATTTVNNTVNNTTNQPITSAERTTAPSSTTLHIVATVNSILGDGFTRFYERQVLVRVRYGTVTGVYPYVSPPTGYTTIDLGADNTANTVNLSFALGAAGTYKFVVEYTSADDPFNGTFAGDNEQYVYLTGVPVNATVNGALAEVNPGDGALTAAVAGPTFPAFTPTAGYSVYQVDYTLAFGYYLYTTLSTYACDASISWPNSGYDNQDGGTFNVPASTKTTTTTSATFSTSPASGITISAYSSSSYLYTTGNGGIQTGVEGLAQGKVFATGSVATIYQRKANTNSTTIANTFTLNSFYTNLSASASVIPGELSWIAIG